MAAIGTERLEQFPTAECHKVKWLSGSEENKGDIFSTVPIDGRGAGL
jgi:hypothetical protein